MPENEIRIDEKSVELGLYIDRLIRGEEASEFQVEDDDFIGGCIDEEAEALRLAQTFYGCTISFFKFGDHLHCRIRLDRVIDDNFLGMGEEDGHASDFCLIVCRAALVAYKKLDRQYMSAMDGNRPISIPTPDRKIRDIGDEQ